MTIDRMALQALLEKGSDDDLLKTISSKSGPIALLFAPTLPTGELCL